MLGLLPGIGDALSAGLAAYPVVIAVRHRLTNSVVLRMLGNIALDTLAGSIPILGDVFDVGFKANVRNAALIAGIAILAIWIVRVALDALAR